MNISHLKKILSGQTRNNFDFLGSSIAPKGGAFGADFGDPPFEIFCEWRNKIDKRIVSLLNCWSMFIKFSGICEYILDLWASLETSETLIF